jgi:RNA-directed DNA polymerase
MEGGKMRRIYKLPYYPDRIVQHALMSAVGPIFRRSLIRDTFQSLPERGTSDARRRVQKMMKSDPQAYALKMDIRKYYPNVNNDKLKEVIRRKIKCKDTLWLMDNIIDSMSGLPIGNLTSQYFGNIFLYEFDWWVKQELKVKVLLQVLR